MEATIGQQDPSTNVASTTGPKPKHHIFTYPIYMVGFNIVN